MNFKKISLLILMNLILVIYWSQPTIIKNDFRSPIGIPILLSGNFGELRSNHFHAGLDIKTNGTINYRIYAIEKGYISRINISHWGYGKAIYVDHPNGYTSVYAHLDHFPKKIEKLIRDYQYENQSEVITYYLDSGLINVEKGEVIAYSGNSGGSSGPHLHFEIRETISEHPVNPQLFGFEIEDSRPPEINKLIFYDLGSSTVNGKCGRQEFNLKKTKKSYTLVNDSIIKVNGKFGIGLSTVDYYNKTYNKCGIYSMDLWVDENLKFSQKLNELDFSTTKQINIHKDFKAYFNKRESIHKAYIHPSNELAIYERELGDGTVEITDSDLHKVTLIVSDIKGNSSELNFYVKKDHTNLCNQNNKSFKKPNSIQSIASLDSNVIIYMDSNTLYDQNQEINIDIDKDDVIHLAKNEVPVKEKFIVSLKINNSYITDKWLLAHIDKNGKIKNRKGIVDGDNFKASLNHFGDFKLMVDTIPPKISSIYQPSKIKKNQIFKFQLTDDLSGVEEYKVTIDGNWILSNYSYKSSLLKIPLDVYTNLEIGDHNGMITVKDERGNELNYSFDFSIVDN